MFGLSSESFVFTIRCQISVIRCHQSCHRCLCQRRVKCLYHQSLCHRCHINNINVTQNPHKYFLCHQLDSVYVRRNPDIYVKDVYVINVYVRQNPDVYVRGNPVTARWEDALPLAHPCLIALHNQIQMEIQPTPKIQTQTCENKNKCGIHAA